MRTSTARTPRFCAHATPPNVTGPRGDVLTAAGHVDAGLRLDRSARRPAQPRPVRLGPVESRQFQVDHPLGRRHVAVQPRDNQTRRVSVFGGQRLAVHSYRQQGVAAVGERIDGGTDGEAVDRRRQHHIGVTVNTGRCQQVSHPIAGPRRVGDEIAADRIGHTRQRDHLLDDVEPLQILETIGDLAVHHAVDPQLPVGPAELGHAQRGVDTVEVGVGCDERRQRNAFRLHRRRHRCGADICSGKREALAIAGHRGQPAVQRDAGHGGEGPCRQESQCHQREPSTGVGGVVGVGSVREPSR